MSRIHKALRGAGGALLCLTLALVPAACNNSQLGSVLGSVLGQGQGNQVSGAVLGVDTRSQQLQIQMSNGQTVTLGYDQNTTVTYQNQQYQVTNLERGDQVTVAVQDAGNGSYYASTIQVDQSVSSGSSNGGVYNGSGTANVQTFQGVVQQVDRSNGLFAVDVGNGVGITVSLPYNVSRNDQTTFQNLRIGDRVRFYGTYLNNTRVELRQFY